MDAFIGVSLRHFWAPQNIVIGTATRAVLLVMMMVVVMRMRMRMSRAFVLICAEIGLLCHHSQVMAFCFADYWVDIGGSIQEFYDFHM